MKKNIYVKIRNYRTTASLDEQLQLLATKSNRNESDLVREAVWNFVKLYRDKADELIRIA